MVNGLKGKEVKGLSLLSCLPFILFTLLTYFPLSLSSIQHPASSIQPYWNNFFSDALDNSGFEVRDSQNRLIKSSKAQAALKELFTLTVFKLLVEEDLPLISAVRKHLEKLLNPFSAAFSRSIHFFEIASCFALAMTRQGIVGSIVRSFLPTLYSDPSLRSGRLFESLTAYRLSLNLPLRC